MIQVTPQMRVLVAVEPVDFRRGMDGLARLCRDALQRDPMSGAVFVFRNRRGTSVRLLTYDGQGLWLATKRLSSGRFPCWPRASGATSTLEAHELMVLLQGGDPDAARGAPKWRPLSLPA